MLPGITSKLTSQTLPAATTLDAKTDILFLTGNTTVQNINPNFGGGFGGIVVLISLTAGGVPIVNTGNIAEAGTVSTGRAVVLYFSRGRGKWYANF